MPYPLQIKEETHCGSVKNWVLHNEDHLEDVILDAWRAGYKGIGTLDDYLEWLKVGLKTLDVGSH